MAEKINLAEFDIDVDKLISETIGVKQRIDEIRTEMKQMAKDGKTSSEAFINNAVSLKELNKEYSAQLKILGEVNSATGKTIPLQQQLDTVLGREVKTINDLRKQNSDLLKTRNNVNIKTAEGQKQLKLINDQLDRNNVLIKENVSEREKQILSVGGYTEAIKNAFQGTGLFGGAMNDMKGVVQSLSPVFNSLTANFTQIYVDLRNVTAGTEGLTTAQKALAVSTNVATAGLKLFRLALIATGIGAIVVALGSLVAMFKSSEEGQNRLNKILGVAGSIIGNLVDLLADFGDVLFNAFTNPKQAWDSFVSALKSGYEFIKGQIVDRFIASWNVLTGEFERSILKMRLAWAELVGDGEKAQSLRDEITEVESKIVESANIINEKNQEIVDLYNDAKNAVTGFIGELKEEARAAAEVADMRAAADLIERQLLVERSQREREISELRLKARQEEEFSAKQRAQFLLEAQAIQDGLIAKEVEYLTLRRDAQKLENTFARSTKANLDAEAQAEADLNNAVTARINTQRQTQRELNTLNKQAGAEAKKVQDEAIARQKESLDLFIAEQGIRARTLEQGLELERQVSEKRKAILQQELDAKKISQEKYQTEILKLNNDLLKKQAELAADNAQRELNDLSARLEKEKEANEFMTQARLEGLEAQQQALADAQISHEQLRFEQGLINEQEYQDALKQIELEKDASLTELRKERDEAAREQRALDRETEFNALIERNASVFELENLQIEQQRERDLEAARIKYTDEAMLAQAILNINSEADRAQVQLAVAAGQAKLDAQKELFGGISQILGEETALGKAAAIAQVGIQTYQAAMSSYASLAAIPVVGPALGFAAAAAAVAFGIGQAGKISGIDTGIGGANLEGLGSIAGAATDLGTPQLNLVPGFAGGGVVRKDIPIHRSNGDNVLVTAKTGEAFLNEEQQNFIGRDLLALAGVPGFATGGIVGSSNMTTVQNIIGSRFDKAMADTLGEAVREGAQTGTSVGAQQGIVDLSAERSISNIATF